MHQRHTVDLEVTIYDRTGRRLQTLTDALRPAGRSQGESTHMAEQSARCITGGSVYELLVTLRGP